ncbi:MAG: tRNA nucleotidyltransferase [Deltaproteobacteria bacterium]|nr:MAG: tRNA nucleotidyltransferase [Deltaproteobacteria bacterium]
MKIYRVGGSVRDYLLQIKNYDYDNDFVVFETNEKQLLEKFPDLKKIGNRKPVFISGQNQFIISEYKDIYEDLDSRDLTINAVAMDMDNKIIFHPEAEKDLHEKILRPVSTHNFFSDPLRVFRAARFASQFHDFTISDELKNAMKLTAEKKLTSQISPERVGNELKKAFSSVAPEKFLLLLNETHNLNPWLKEFENSHKIPAGPVKYHGNSTLLTHTIRCMNKVYGNPLLVWMAFCHDIGKSRTPEDILPSHYKHEKNGAVLAEKLGKRLRLPNRFIQGGVLAAKNHMKTGQYEILKSSTKVKLLLELYNKDFFRELFIITSADKEKNFFDSAEKDLKKILSIKLPENKKNLGEKSGQILFQMQCEALKGR